MRPFGPCLSLCPVLSVTLVYCGQTVRRIKMKLGMQVSLGPGHIVLDGDPAPLPQRGTAPFPISGPYLLRPNGCIDQDMSLGMELGLGPGDFCVRWGPRSLPKNGQSPQFSAHVYCDQTAKWIKMPLGMEVGLDRSDIVAKRLHGSRCQLVWR